MDRLQFMAKYTACIQRTQQIKYKNSAKIMARQKMSKSTMERNARNHLVKIINKNKDRKKNIEMYFRYFIKKLVYLRAINISSE